MSLGKDQRRATQEVKTLRRSSRQASLESDGVGLAIRGLSVGQCNEGKGGGEEEVEEPPPERKGEEGDTRRAEEEKQGRQVTGTRGEEEAVYMELRPTSSGGTRGGPWAASVDSLVFRHCGSQRIQVIRSADAKKRNPDRLFLDRCGLTCCPLLLGEESLQLLSLQSNQITCLESLDLPKLAFLDLQGNRLQRLQNGLQSLPRLRVLMLGRNHLQGAQGLQGLQFACNLRVLDLQGNWITHLPTEVMSLLRCLRVLNLSENKLQDLQGLQGLVSLRDLDLSRNCVVSVYTIPHLPALRRLCLDCNRICTLEDLQGLEHVSTLEELSMKNNDVVDLAEFLPKVLCTLPSLLKLGPNSVTFDQRRGAQAWLQSSQRDASSSYTDSSAEEVTPKEVTSGSSGSELESTSSGSVRVRAMYRRAPSAPLLRYLETPPAPVLPALVHQESPPPPPSVLLPSVPAVPAVPPSPRRKPDPSVPQITIIEDRLEITGSENARTTASAVRTAIQHWSGSAAATAAVHTLCIQNVPIDALAPHFGRLKSSLPSLIEVQVGPGCDLQWVGQLNSLAHLQGIASLQVHQRNPLAGKEMYRPYAVYRLSHWGLAKLDGKGVGLEEGKVAQQQFGSLGRLALTCVPPAALTPLAARLKADDSDAESDSGSTPAKVSWEEDPVLQEVIGKEALMCRPSLKDDPVVQQQAHSALNLMLGQALECLQKLNLLEKEWPSVLQDKVQGILLDYTCLDSHKRRCLRDLCTTRKHS